MRLADDGGLGIVASDPARDEYRSYLATGWRILHRISIVARDPSIEREAAARLDSYDAGSLKNLTDLLCFRKRTQSTTYTTYRDHHVEMDAIHLHPVAVRSSGLLQGMGLTVERAVDRSRSAANSVRSRWSTVKETIRSRALRSKQEGTSELEFLDQLVVSPRGTRALLVVVETQLT